jgi:CheY-like chemotaxis protein
MVLIIDDNKDLAGIIFEYLNMVGYEADVAFSGEEGIAKAKQHKPGAILCDIGMSGMKGYDVAEYIRRDAELKDVYLIAISGYSSQSDVERSLKAGFNKYLSKPINFDYLKKVLDNLGANRVHLIHRNE